MCADPFVIKEFELDPDAMAAYRDFCDNPDSCVDQTWKHLVLDHGQTRGLPLYGTRARGADRGDGRTRQNPCLPKPQNKALQLPREGRHLGKADLDSGQSKKKKKRSQAEEEDAIIGGSTP